MKKGKTQKPVNGGAREGSGRKKLGRQAYCIRMFPSTMREITRQGKANHPQLAPGPFLESQFQPPPKTPKKKR